MDSLMALDLKNRLQAAIGLPLRATVVFNYSTVDTLAEFLMRQIAPPTASDGPEGATAESPGVPTDALSDKELVRFFDEQLAAIEGTATPQPGND